MRLRGLVWLGVGLLVYVGGFLMGRPILLRWTDIPLGWVIMAAGVAYQVYDYLRHRRDEKNGSGEP
jgi:hypothetical protein